MVKNLPAMREPWVQFLRCEDPLEEGMATHSDILAWRIPWTEEPGNSSATRTRPQFWKAFLNSFIEPSRYRSASGQWGEIKSGRYTDIAQVSHCQREDAKMVHLKQSSY